MLGGIGCSQRTEEKQVLQSYQSPGLILDTVITKKIPLTMDDEWATIYYNLKVKNWKKPVEWTFFILHKKDTVYAADPNLFDVIRDTLFYDFGFLPQAPETTYLGQKKYYYLVRNIEFWSDTLYKRDTIKHKGMELTHTDSVWSYYKDKPIILYSFFAGHGEEDPGAWAYYPKIKKMVCIYAP